MRILDKLCTKTYNEKDEKEQRNFIFPCSCHIQDDCYILTNNNTLAITIMTDSFGFYDRNRTLCSQL